MKQSTIQLVPEGYKQTEVGIIPEDWNFKTIGEIANVSSGGTPNRKVSEFWNGDIPWVTTTLINGHAIYYANEYITKKGLDFSSAKMCRSGTLLMAMYGQGKTRGKVGVLSFDASINQACAAISLTDNCSNVYVLHVLNSMYDNIRELSNSGGQENLSGGIIKKISLPLPSSEEQTAIANALSDIDTLLSELEKLIAKKQAIKTAAMQQLLTGKTRLPQFATYVDGDKHGQVKNSKLSELGEISEDWDVKSLGEFLIFKNGLNKEKEFFGYGTPIVNYMDVYGSSEIRANSVKGKVFVTSIEQKNYSAKKGDVFFTRTSETTDEIGLASVLLDEIEGSVFSGFVLRARQKNHVFISEFMKYCFGSEHIRKQIQSTASYTTRALTNGQLLSRVLISIPPKKEQTAIATILSDMDEEIQALKQRLSKTRQIKQGMMQELLTGKTRLPFEKGDTTSKGVRDAN